MGFIKSIFSKNEEENLVNTGNDKYKLRDFNEAISDYSAAIQINPEIPAPFYGRAISKFALKDFSGAKEDFFHLDKNFPDFSIRIYYYLGIIELEENFPETCIEFLTKYLSKNGKDSDAYFNRAKAKVILGKSQEAIEDFDNAIESDPTNWEALLSRGIEKYKLKDFKHSVIDFNNSIEIQPNNAKAFNCRGVAKEQLKEIEDALKDFLSAMEIEPSHATAAYNYARLKSDEGNYDAALEYLDKAVHSKEDFIDAYLLRAIVQIET